MALVHRVAHALSRTCGSLASSAAEAAVLGALAGAVAACASAQRAPDIDHETDGAAVVSRPDSLQREGAAIEYQRGTALLAASRADEAKAPLLNAVRLAPGEAAYRVALAACLAALGERTAAMETLRDASRLSLSPADADRAVRLARALTDPFRNVAPADRSAVDRALRALERDAPGQALDELDALLTRSPAIAPAHLLAALAAERLGESARALAELREAARLAPDLPQPHAYLGRLSIRDSPEVAARELEEAVKRNPLDPAVLRSLGELELDRLGQPGRAAESLGRAADLTQDDAGLQALASRAEFAAGQLAAGRRRLEAAIRGRRGNPQALLHLGAAVYDERSRATGEVSRAALTRCIEAVVETIEQVDPENAAARGLNRAAHGG